MTTRMTTTLVIADVRAEDPLVRSYAGFLLQFIFSSGILATLYSRCSLTIVQTVRFFCIISSSRSLSPASHDSYHANSQSQVSGLSGKYIFELVLDRIHFIAILRTTRIISLMMCSFSCSYLSEGIVNITYP